MSVLLCTFTFDSLRDWAWNWPRERDQAEESFVRLRPKIITWRVGACAKTAKEKSGLSGVRRRSCKQTGSRQFRARLCKLRTLWRSNDDQCSLQQQTTESGFYYISDTLTMYNMYVVYAFPVHMLDLRWVRSNCEYCDAINIKAKHTAFSVMENYSIYIFVIIKYSFFVRVFCFMLRVNSTYTI